MKLKIDRPFHYLGQQWGKSPTLAWGLSIAWLVLVSWLAFLWHLGSTGLVDETEPLFAEAARQMTVTGDWITPYFNGLTRFDKPPLIYWLVAIGYKTLGVNEWAARLPSALATIALTCFAFVTLRYFGYPSPSDVHPDADSTPERWSDRRLWLAAWIGAALIALNPQTIVWARTGVSDALLSGCMGTALLAFFWGYTAPPASKAKARWYLAFSILSALAVLAKGPVGIVIPGLVIIAFLLYLGNLLSVLREMQVIRNGLIFLAITIPWYILVILANGEAYINSFFGYHNFERFTRVVNNHSAPWFFYFLVVLLGFAPWSIYLPAAIARLRFWQRSHWQQQPRSAHLALFALIWFAVIFGFFTIAVTKLPSYTLPLLPAAAMLVGLFWSDLMTRERSSRGIFVNHLVSLGFLALLSWATFYSPNWLTHDPAMPEFPQAIRQSGIHLWGGAVWAMGAIATLILLLRRQGRWLWLVNLMAFSSFVLFVVMPAAFIMDANRQQPLRELATAIVQEQKPGEEVIMVGFQKPTVVFYSQQFINFIPEDDDLKPYLQKSGSNRSPSSVLVLGLPERIKDAHLRPNEYQIVKDAGAYRLIRVALPLQE